MNILSTVAIIIADFGVVFGALIAIKRTKDDMHEKLEKVMEGQKCQLRSEMLRTYYQNKDASEIRQFEFENFIKLYEAYKALGGNSFIDKIHEEVCKWEIIT